MGEKQEVQVEQSAQEEQPESNETPQLTKEKFEELQKELEKAKNQVNTFQGLLKDTQKKSITRDDLSHIYDRIDGQQRWIATALDDIRQGGDYEEQPKSRKSYSEDAEENITKAKESRQTPVDPEAEKFFKYLEEEGLDWEDEFVQGIAKESQTPQDALKNLKGKVKERNEAKIRSELKKEIESERNNIREEILKELGYTTTGAMQPSASNRDLSSMTPDEKLNYGFEQLKKKK